VAYTFILVRRTMLLPLSSSSNKVVDVTGMVVLEAINCDAELIARIINDHSSEYGLEKLR
jgi:hypothetical protein